MGQGNLRSVRAAIISTALILAAPASAGDNKFVFAPQSDSPGNDYQRWRIPRLKTVHRNVTPRINVMRLPTTSSTASVS